MQDFYHLVETNNIPFVALGIGSIGKLKKDPERKIIKDAKILTFRTRTLAEQAKKQGLHQAMYLPCPALLSAPLGTEKEASDPIKIVGLGFNVKNNLTAPHIGLSDDTFIYMNELFDKFIRRYSDRYKFIAICHYIDELPYAIRFFKKYGIEVRYSYDSNDYYSIYNQIDCLISSRVHGCGISSSLGIPSIGISHDNRGETIKGFLASTVTVGDSFDKLDNEFSIIANNLQERHQSLIEHKNQTLNSYIEIIESKLHNYM